MANGEVADTDAPDFPVINQFVERRQGLLDRNHFIGPVDQIEVHVLCTEFTQTPVAVPYDIMIP